MELDKRIKEGKKPLTCFDVKEAKQFIGKECYLSNSIADYADLNNVTAKRIELLRRQLLWFQESPLEISFVC